MSDERSKLIKKLDKLVSEYVVLRDGKCITCWITYGLCCGHLFSRTWLATRFDLMNCQTQCFSCNGIHEENERPYKNAFIKRYGREEYEILDKLHNTIAKYSISDLKEIYNTIKQKYNELL